MLWLELRLRLELGSKLGLASIDIPLDFVWLNRDDFAKEFGDCRVGI